MTKLLVSVRDAAEARSAVRAGADWIDVKEPDHGSLGAASPTVLHDVLAAVDRAAPCSAALGELLQSRCEDFSALPPRCQLAKIGLSGCDSRGDWRSLWKQRYAAAPQSVGSVVVVYADWRTAGSPSPQELLEWAVEVNSRYVLIDTFEKDDGDLFRCFGAALPAYCESIRRHGLTLVLAGSLTLATAQRAAALHPAYIAVRGAVCSGDRRSKIDAERVRKLRAVLDGEAEEQIAISSFLLP